MKFEYQQDSLVLKVLDTSHTVEVLDFYKRNKDSFEKYETDNRLIFIRIHSSIIC